jgi:hypothetical protein
MAVGLSEMILRGFAYKLNISLFVKGEMSWYYYAMINVVVLCLGTSLGYYSTNYLYFGNVNP